MLPRYLLVFAVLALSIRGMYLLYVLLLKNEIRLTEPNSRPNNHKVSYVARNISVGTAKSKSTSSISTQRRSTSKNTARNESYSSYRSRQKSIK